MIYHIAERKAWEEALNSGQYSHPSLQTEGFIHCSTKEQVEPTANFVFQNHPATELLVLHIVEKRVANDLKTEPGQDGNLYPHHYGKLPITAVEDLSVLNRDASGSWVWNGPENN